MTIDVATAIARILKQEGVEWVSTFPVCRVNNALGREGVPMVMMRDDRYAIALADGILSRYRRRANWSLHRPGWSERCGHPGRLRRSGAGIRGWLSHTVHH